MSDQLEVIRRIIEWHKTIRGHARLVGESVTDIEALITLEKARTDWVPGRLEALSEKKDKLQQVISLLDEGLKNHFDYEEKALPPLLGDLVMRAIVLQHNEIIKETNEAKSMHSFLNLEELNRDELLAEELRVQQRIGIILQLVEEHATREDLVLEMVQNALEKKEEEGKKK